jgi:hypothetical protein
MYSDVYIISGTGTGSYQDNFYSDMDRTGTVYTVLYWYAFSDKKILVENSISLSLTRLASTVTGINYSIYYSICIMVFVLYLDLTLARYRVRSRKKSNILSGRVK